MLVVTLLLARWAMVYAIVAFPYGRPTGLGRVFKANTCVLHNDIDLSCGNAVFDRYAKRLQIFIAASKAKFIDDSESHALSDLIQQPRLKFRRTVLCSVCPDNNPGILADERRFRQGLA